MPCFWAINHIEHDSVSLNLYVKQKVVAFVASAVWDIIKEEPNKNICQNYMNTPVMEGDLVSKQKVISYKSWFGLIVYHRCKDLYDTGRKIRSNLFITQDKHQQKLKDARLSSRKKQVILSSA